MTEQECLDRMVAPGTPRAGKYRQGVIQVHLTRACDLSCYNCTQGSNLAGRVPFMSVENFEKAVLSLKGYWGVVGVFGGNPCLHPKFEAVCEVLRRHVPFDQRGLWSNRLMGHGRTCRMTFDPSVSNLNVHLSKEAYDEMKRDWPECHPVGLDKDSRHAPVHLAMKDVLWRECEWCQPGIEKRDDSREMQTWQANCPNCHGTGKVYDEPRAWELISGCDINQHWSAMLCEFRGQLRAFFCEVAGAQAMLHQDEEEYPDTGIEILNDGMWKVQIDENISAHREPISYWPKPGTIDIPDFTNPVDRPLWWQLPMRYFSGQVRKHCHECGVPLRGRGELAQAADGAEQTSAAHAPIYRPKRKGRRVEVVTELIQLGVSDRMVTKYLEK